PLGDHGVDGGPTVAGGDDVVAAGTERHGERPDQLHVVVRDQDLHLPTTPRCPAIGSRTTTVSPPPGVSSTSIVPPMPSVNPRASARPSPSPVSLSVSPSRWNGWNTSSRRS